MALTYFKKMGNKESKNVKVVKINVEILVIKQDHN